MRSDIRAIRQRTDQFQFDYPIAFAAVAICSAAGIILRSRLAITNIAMIHLLGTIIISVTCRRAVAIIGAVAGVASFYYFSVPPWNSFTLEDYSYVVILITTLAVSLVITTLTSKIRLQTAQALEREAQARAMYQLSRELSSETDVEHAARTAIQTITTQFDAVAAIFLPDDERIVRQVVCLQGRQPAGPSEVDFVQPVLENGMKSIALFRVDNRIEARLVLPLLCGGAAVGVLTVVPADRDRFNDNNQMRFLEALCDQIAAAVERLRSLAAVREAEVEIQSERTRNALLNAVSHDIKTPLASIYGAATSLLEEETRLSPAARHDLVESISDEADRLNRVVNNLLEMTRLDAGLQARKDWRPLEEIVGAALARLEPQLRERPISVQIAEDLPWLCVDDVLIEQVFVNILENAAKYTPADSRIEIAAQCCGENIVITIKDSGAGIAPGDEERVFEKFFRGKTEGARGVGLGLAICRAIVQSHDGSICAENSATGGAVFRFELPIGGVPPQTSVVPETTF